MTTQAALALAGIVAISFPTHCTDAAVAALANDLARYDEADATEAIRIMRNGRTDLRFPAWADIRQAIDQVTDRKRISEDHRLNPAPPGRVDPERIFAYVDALKAQLKMQRRDRPTFTRPPWVAARERRLERERRNLVDLAGVAMSPVRENGQIDFTEAEKRLINDRLVRASSIPGTRAAS